MLHNLIAEMARYQVTRQAMAYEIGVNVRTLQNKLKGTTDFTVPEARKIKDTFFPRLDLQYLFEKDEGS